MIEKQHLLFELGSEELPPKTLLKLSNALLDGIVQGLQTAELTFTGSKAYATPRRLAVLIENLSTAQPDKTVEKRGPAIQAAFAPDRTPSKAALGFAASCCTTFDQLERLKTDKGEWLSFTQAVKGQVTEDLIPDIIRQSIANLPIAKRMRWGSFNTEFVRPETLGTFFIEKLRLNRPPLVAHRLALRAAAARDTELETARQRVAELEQRIAHLREDVETTAGEIHRRSS